MQNLRNWMLGAAMLAGAGALAATPAQAAEIGVYVHGPVVYAPPSPGPGYMVAAGYNYRGHWVPERRDYRRYDRFDRDRFRGFDRGRVYDHRFDRNRFRR